MQKLAVFRDRCFPLKICQPWVFPLLTLLGDVSWCLRDSFQAIADNQGNFQIFVFGVVHCQLSVLPSPKETEWLENVSDLLWLFVWLPLGSVDFLTTGEYFCRQTGLLHSVWCAGICAELWVHPLEKKSRSGFKLCVVFSCLKLFCSQRRCLRSSCCDCSCLGWLLSLRYSVTFFIFCFVCASWRGLLAWSGLWASALAGLRAADSPVHDSHVGDPWTNFQKMGMSAWCSRASIRATSSCPEVRISVLLCGSVSGPLPEQLVQ